MVMELARSVFLAVLLFHWMVLLSAGASEGSQHGSNSSESGAATFATELMQQNASNTSSIAIAAVSEAMSSPTRLRGSAAKPPVEHVDASTTLEKITWDLQPCSQKDGCLRIVDEFLVRQPKQQGQGKSLLQAYDSPMQGGGGPCGALCDLRPRCVSDTCRYYVYDNAVAAIYFVHRGNLSEARLILDSLTPLLYPHPGNLNLLYSAYAENGDVLDWSIDTGNNAWVGMAFTHYAAASGEACYAHIARDILHSLAEQAGCNDELQGFMGRLPRGRGKYRATEHNIDMFAFSRMLDEQEVQERAARFVSQMYGFSDLSHEAYATGTGGSWMCDNSKAEGSPIAADTQFWNILSDADPDANRKQSSLQFMLRPSSEGGLLADDVDIIGDGARLHGVRFTTKGAGAQWENTASAVMGIGFYAAVYADQGGISHHLQAMQDSLLHQLQKYKTVLASVRGGNYHAYKYGNSDPAFPGGSDTGLGWTYLRYPHLAATAWTGLMLLEANPFAPPNQKLPTGVPDASCPVAR